MKSSLAQRLKAHHRQRRVQTVVFLVLFAVLFLLALPGAELDFSKFADGLPRMADFLGRMVPPDMSVMTTVLTSTLETLQIAFVGTFLSVVLSFPLALMAATNLAPAWLSQPTRWLLGAIRAVPLILLALFFVSTVGLGPFPGVLAITVHSVGMLGKFYAEAFENADPGVLEALDSAGATLLQRLRFGIFTQVAPDLVRDTLFRLELNFRESLILGLVGAGGIGFYIQLYIRAFQYERVATLTITLLVIVIIVELISTRLRQMLR
ncbi:MAG: phosphonate ABC transporter, permease protein PhnE [Truepera sp.]|nr:phosphonate ABC transporter, permease protein PhnE [Truepera sp.]